MGNGYETTFDQNGAVIQAGVRSPGERPASLDGNPLGLLHEAVVLAIHYPENEIRKVGRQSCITADVRVIGLTSKQLFRVPILQAVHGIFDEDLVVPRSSAQAIDGSILENNPKGTTGTKATQAELQDGDHVIICYLDGVVSKPRILPIQAPHPNARNLPLKANGRVRRIRHNGTLLEWDKDGNWTLDATTAAQSSLGAKGTETSNSGTGGKITLKTKDGAGAQSTIYMDNQGGVKITDGSGGYIEMVKSSKTIKMQAPGGVFDLDAGDISAIATVSALLKGQSATLQGILTAAVTAPSVSLGTGTQDFLMQATKHTAALGAALGALGTYCGLVGSAMDVLINAQGLSQSDKATVVKAGSSAAGGATGAAATFTGTAVTWTSKKVTTG